VLAGPVKVLVQDVTGGDPDVVHDRPQPGVPGPRPGRGAG
jgi:hypothetical protein